MQVSDWGVEIASYTALAARVRDFPVYRAARQAMNLDLSRNMCR